MFVMMQISELVNLSQFSLTAVKTTLVSHIASASKQRRQWNCSCGKCIGVLTLQAHKNEKWFGIATSLELTDDAKRMSQHFVLNFEAQIFIHLAFCFSPNLELQKTLKTNA